MSKMLLRFVIIPSIIFGIFTYVIRVPNYNWDIVFYIGTLFNSDNKTVEESRLETVEALKSSPYIDYEYIDPKDQYGENVFSKDQSYIEQFSFYNIRILYNSITKIIYEIGFDPALSVYLNSVISAFFIIFILYFYILYKIGNSFFSALLCLIIIIHNGFKESITSSPDTLSTLFVLLIIISLYEKKNLALYIFSFLALLSRTDNIIFIFFILLLNGVLNVRNKQIFYSIIVLLINISLYFSLNSLYKNTGYRLLFYHTFVEHISYPLTKPIQVSMSVLLNSFKQNIVNLIHPIIYLGFLFVFNNTKNKLKNNFVIVSLVIIICFTFSIKYMLFPSSHYRFTFQYIIFGMLLSILFFSKEIKKQIN